MQQFAVSARVNCLGLTYGRVRGATFHLFRAEADKQNETNGNIFSNFGYNIILVCFSYDFILRNAYS